jgi:hypothetical protein
VFHHFAARLNLPKRLSLVAGCVSNEAMASLPPGSMLPWREFESVVCIRFSELLIVMHGRSHRHSSTATISSFDTMNDGGIRITVLDPSRMIRLRSLWHKSLSYGRRSTLREGDAEPVERWRREGESVVAC